MCSQELVYPIPVAPVTIVVISGKATIIHPSIDSISSWKSTKPESSKITKVEDILRSLDVTSEEHMVGVIDERTTVRTILSFIATQLLEPDQKFIVKEEIYDKILGLRFHDTPSKSTFASFFKEISDKDDIVPTYGGWNEYIAPRGPFVFNVITHDINRLHSFPQKEKMISSKIIKDIQKTNLVVYDTFKIVKEEVPCSDAKVIHASYTARLKDVPNLIYLNNNLELTNDMPCIVYRPTLNELQMKSKLYLPRIQSKWKKEEMKLLLTTTAISKENKFTSLPKRGLFIWYQVGWETTSISKGIVQETLENGDILVKDSSTSSEMIVPPTAVKHTKPLQETEVNIGKPIWALLHIHQKGLITLNCPNIKIAKELQEKIEKMIHLDGEGWKSNHFQVHYDAKSTMNRELAQAMINTIGKMKSYLFEKRDIVPIGNQIEWFSVDDQSWKKGVVESYPDLKTYSIKTSKGKKKVPWTYIRIPKQPIDNRIDLVMEKVSNRRFIHPLANHIQSLREKGYNIGDIQANLSEAFSIDPAYSLALIAESLEASQQGNPGVIVQIPIYSYESPTVSFEVSGKELTDVLYTFRLIQVYIYLSKQKKIGSQKDADVEDEEEEDELLELEDDISLDDDLDLDDIDIDEEVDQLKEMLESGDDAESVAGSVRSTSSQKSSDIKTITSTKISIFLQALYDRDPALFNWQSRIDRKDRYATICQENTRHPKLMTNETKIEVDQNNPGSYGLSSYARASGHIEDAERLEKTEKSCDGVSEVIGKGDACVAILHGSGQDKSWYICPRIYDLLEQKPLRLQDLDFESPFTPKGWIKSEWRVDKSGRDILQFEPTYKGRGVVRNLRQSDYNEYSLYIAPMKAKYFYPGFLSSSSHPEMLSMPCCFTKSNNKLEELYGIQEPKKAGSANYIQGWKKSLGWDPPRLGLIPPTLRKYFNLHPELYKTGYVHQTQKGHPMWLRRGIPYSPNPFISCLANNESDSMDEIIIRKQIIDNVTPQTFSMMNGGLMELFLQNVHNRQSAIDMYITNLLFGTNLSWLDVLDAYCITKKQKQVWILIDASDSFKPTLLDTSLATYHEKLLKQLFVLQNRQPKLAESWRVCFAIKQGLSWSPIYKIKQIDKTYDVYRGIPGNDPQAIFWINQRVRKVRALQQVPRQLYQIKTKNTPSDLVKIYETKQYDLKQIRPVYSRVAQLTPNYFIGFFSESFGFHPFYLQPLPISISGKIGSPIEYDEITKTDSLHALEDYEKFYQDNSLESPIIAGQTMANGVVFALSTVYGIDIPMKELAVDSFGTYPVLMTTKEDWEVTVRETLRGQCIGCLKKPVALSVVLGILNKIKSFVPYYFLYDSENKHKIIGLVLKVVKGDKIQRTLTIPILPRVVSDETLLSLRKQVGLRESKLSHGQIPIDPSVSLQTTIDDMNELRLLTHKQIPIGPVYYIFSQNKIIGIEDECGFKYILDGSKRLDATSLHERTQSFVVQPLHLSKYQYYQEQERENELHDTVMDVFISLFSLPYWKEQIESISKFAQTANTWKQNIGAIMKIMERFVGEIHKRRKDISLDFIRQQLIGWVSHVSWDSTLRQNVVHKDFQKSVSVTDFKTTEKELLVESLDIETFANIHSALLSSNVIPLQQIEMSQKSVPIIGMTTDLESEEDEIEVEDEEPSSSEGEHKGTMVSEVVELYYSPARERIMREPTDTVIIRSTDIKTVVARIGDKHIIKATVIE